MTRTVFLALAMLPPTSGGSAQSSRVSGESTQLKYAARIIGSYHVARNKQDDAIARRWFDAFVGTADPAKMLFLAGDVAAWHKHRKMLPQAAIRGDMTLANGVETVLQRRRKQVTAWIESLLDAEYRFDRDESTVWDYESFAETERELRERRRKRIKLELLLEIVNGRDKPAAVRLLRERYRRIARTTAKRDRIEVERDFIDALARACDPHSGYLSRRDLSWFESGMTLRRHTLGIPLRRERGRIVIHDFTPDLAPTGRMRRGDWILAIGRNDDSEMIDVVGMSWLELLDVIRWKLGRDRIVRLQFSRPCGVQRYTHLVDRFDSMFDTDVPSTSHGGLVADSRASR